MKTNTKLKRESTIRLSNQQDNFAYEIGDNPEFPEMIEIRYLEDGVVVDSLSFTPADAIEVGQALIDVAHNKLT